MLDDGFAFTEVSVSDLDFNQFLAANKRYRITAEVFFEIQAILLRETERRIREGDRTLMTRIGRYMPGLPKDQHLRQTGLVKIVMNGQVLPCLLGDAWGVGAKLQASAVLRAESERRKPTEFIDAFLEVVTNARRFELVSQARDRVQILSVEQGELDDKASRGLRFYDFGESSQVQNNAVNATVLFLDLRGFTQTSEGQISERDLTRELYTVFDSFIPIVERFGGTVDKFLGDGIMITYGTKKANPLDPLNAVRTAILCQETLAKQREQGATYFKMGIAVHYGRVYLARFVADEETLQTTVIGRNVNLAGRLSSASKKPIEEDEGGEPEPPARPRASGLLVTVDESGVLFNEGIAISRETLAQIESQMSLVHGGRRHRAATTSCCIAGSCSATRGTRSSRASAPASPSTRSTSRSPDGAALHSLETRLRDLGIAGARLRAVPGGRRRGRLRPPGRPPRGHELRGDEPLPLRRRPRDGGTPPARGTPRGRDGARSSPR